MSEEQSPYYNEETDNKKWPLWWIIFPILLVLSLSATGFMYYKYYETTHAADGQSYEKIWKDAVSKHSAEKAELNRELEEIKAKLEEAMRNNTTLATTNTDLEAKLDEKTMALAKKIKSAKAGDPKALIAAKAEIEKLKSLQQVFESKTATLTAENRELIAKVLATEGNVEEAQNKARIMEEQKNALDEKIKNSTLNVADLRVVGLRKKGSTDEETFKAFKTDKLKISFTILDNDLVEAGNKDITIRLLGTNKEVLTNENEKLADSDKLSTMVQTIDYQNDPIKTTIFYSQKATYKKGTYTVELIHNDKLMGRASFILR
ncbi:MAG: hypothetical protein ACKVQB_02305 [Bacteroidia bacterium]